MYNLWGQVPVKGAGGLLQPDGRRVVHSARTASSPGTRTTSSPPWATAAGRRRARPSPGRLDDPRDPAGHAIDVARATYSGTSAPGSTVDLLAGQAGPGRSMSSARAVAGADGAWTATTRPLADGRYRVVAEARLAKAYPGDQPPVPTDAPGLAGGRGRGHGLAGRAGERQDLDDPRAVGERAEEGPAVGLAQDPGVEDRDDPGVVPATGSGGRSPA